MFGSKLGDRAIRSSFSSALMFIDSFFGNPHPMEQRSMFTLSVVKGRHWIHKSNLHFVNRADTLPNCNASGEYSDTSIPGAVDRVADDLVWRANSLPLPRRHFPLCMGMCLTVPSNQHTRRQKEALAVLEGQRLEGRTSDSSCFVILALSIGWLHELLDPWYETLK